mmetsp:Transcript_35658/g.80967  ORF Transcript_35658/g.80967 Transcript_35658/m.80967 type:complete len:228 (+) Transcript_35658:460-1143(+)
MAFCHPSPSITSRWRSFSPADREQISMVWKIREKSSQHIQNLPSSSTTGRISRRIRGCASHSLDASDHAPCHSELPHGLRNCIRLSRVPFSAPLNEQASRTEYAWPETSPCGPIDSPFRPSPMSSLSYAPNEAPSRARALQYLRMRKKASSVERQSVSLGEWKKEKERLPALSTSTDRSSRVHFGPPAVAPASAAFSSFWSSFWSLYTGSPVRTLNAQSVKPPSSRS